MEAILDAMDDGVLVLDQGNRVAYANRVAGRLLATAPAALVGQPLPFAVPTRRITALTLPSGAAMEVRTSGLTWRAQPAHLLVLRDVTMPARAGEEPWRAPMANGFPQGEQFYRVIAQNLPGTDVALFDRECRYIIAEGANLRRTGLAPESMVGKHPRELFGDELWQVLAPLYTGALAGEAGELEFETGHQVYHLRAVPIRDEQGHVYAGMGLAQDMTALKRSEREVHSLNVELEALLERERKARADADRQRELLQEVLDQAPAIMCIHRGPEHVYEYVNDRFCQATKRSPADLLGKGLHAAIPEEVATQLIEILDRVYRSGEPYHNPERRYVHPATPDSPPIESFHSLRYQPIRDAGGQVTGILAHAIDVTESVHARQALEHKSAEVARLNRELEQRVAERTAQLEAANIELEAFAHSVSHDLRGPLRRIDGFGQALIEDHGASLGEEGQHFLARIRAATQSMGELIDDLLALSRISQHALTVREVDLSSMAHRILGTLAEQAPERRVAITVAPNVRVHGDEKFLHIALENLLENAWKFTGKTAGAAIEVGVMEQDGARVLFVRDNGAGFDPSYGAKLFGTFERLHSPEEFPGTGIGLTTVKRVIERHGGRIWAEGAVERGATFYFTLPAPAAAGPPSAR